MSSAASKQVVGIVVTIKIDLRTRTLSSDHKAYMIRSGKEYHLFRRFIEKRAVAPDLPALDIPDGRAPISSRTHNLVGVGVCTGLPARRSTGDGEGSTDNDEYPVPLIVLQSLRGEEVAWSFPGPLPQQCRLPTGFAGARSAEGKPVGRFSSTARLAILRVPSIPDGAGQGIGSNRAPPALRAPGGTSASVPGHDGCPVGSLRLERQYRDRKASWRLVGTKHSKECHGRS